MNTNTKINYLRTLEQFEGDLLAVVEANSQLYVELWSDVASKDSTPWTVIHQLVETTEQEVEDYLALKIDLKTLMHSKGKTWVVTSKGETILDVKHELIENLPKSYQIKAGSFHDPSLGPDA